MTIKIDLKQLEQTLLNEMSSAEYNQIGNTILIGDLEGIKVSLTVCVDDDEDFIGEECLCITEQGEQISE